MTMIKKIAAGMLPTLCLVMAFILVAPALKANADTPGYTSWIQNTDEYEDFYSNAITTQVPDQAQQDDENFLIKLLGTFIHFIGADTANDLSTDRINLTIDGVVMGRLAQPGGVSYTSFDLSAGNVYGTVGATVYTVFRGFAYSGMFLVFLYLLARAVFGSTPKVREELKQGIYALAVNYALIYLMPQITDIVIFLRDNLLYFVMQHLSNDVSILNAMDDLYMADKSLIKAIVYTATVFASLFYIKDYVSIAIQETVLFGFFCLFTVLGTMKKKYLSDWCATFFSNLLVPLVDVVCLMLPYAALKILDTGQIRMSFGGACIVVMMIWSARTVRRELLKLFGSVTNTSAGRGIASLAHMAQMARMAHVAARGRYGNGSGRGGMDTYNDWNDETERQRDAAVSMQQQGSEIGRGLNELGDLESYYSRYSGASTNAGMDEEPGTYACDDYIAAQQYDNSYEIPGDGMEGASDHQDGTGADLSKTVPEEEIPSVPDEAEIVSDGPEGCVEMLSDMPEDETDMPEGEVMEMTGTHLAGTDAGDTGGLMLASEEAGGGEQATGNSNSQQDAQDQDIPDMTDFENNRYNNLQQMGMAEESLDAAKHDIDRWNNENAMLDNRLLDARENFAVETEGDREEITRLGEDNASLDLLIQENDADNRQISALQEQNKEIDREIADEKQSLKGTGETTNDRIESLERRRGENAWKIADLHSGMDDRSRGWTEQADEMEKRRIAGLQEKNVQIDRDIAAIGQTDGTGDGGMRIEELTAQRVANEQRISQAQSRIDGRSVDLRLEKARNTYDMTQAQSRIDTCDAALEKQTEYINRKKLENKEHIAQAQARMGDITMGLEKRKRAEEQFANISRSSGKDGRKYSSAEEMRLHVDQRNKRLAGLLVAAEKRGSISQDMLRDLSPEGAARVAEIQREAIRKSNLRHAMAKVAGGTVKTAAITVGAAAGAVVTMYGGEDASVTGAMLGAMGTRGVLGSVTGAVKAAAGNRQELVADLEAGGEKISAAAQALRGQAEIGRPDTPQAPHEHKRPERGNRPPHERVSQETLAALKRNGRAESPLEDERTAHEKIRDEAMDAIKRNGGRSGS